MQDAYNRLLYDILTREGVRISDRMIGVESQGR